MPALQRLADELAHYHSFSMGKTEETRMANELVAGGLDAYSEIVNYLLSCARGGEKEGWWYNASALVRLMGRLPTLSHADDYRMLMAGRSNIWEFQTQVKDVAEQGLLKIKAELKRIDKMGSIEARLKVAIASAGIL